MKRPHMTQGLVLIALGLCCLALCLASPVRFETWLTATVTYVIAIVGSLACGLALFFILPLLEVPHDD